MFLHPINVNLNQIAQSYIEKMSSKSIKNANKVTLCNTCANKNVIKCKKRKANDKIMQTLIKLKVKVISR